MPSSGIGHIVGLDEFIDRLEQMSYAARQTVLRKAVSEGAKILREEIEHLAPHSSGKLRANIASSVKQPTATQAIAQIGPAVKAFYGRFPETGTVFQSPTQFMLPAFQNKIDEAFAIALFTLLKGIEKRGF